LRLLPWLRDLAERMRLLPILLDSAQTAAESLINRYVRPEQTKGRRPGSYGYRSRIIYL